MLADAAILATHAALSAGVRTPSWTPASVGAAMVQREGCDRDLKDGICTVYVPHTTAGVTINENADPSVPMDIQSALGLTQLGRIESNWRIRKKYWEKIIKGLGDLKELQLPAAVAKGDRHAYHLFAIRLKPEKLKINRDGFMTALQTEGIGVGVHFTPIYQHKFYRENYPNMGKGLEKAELVGNNLISLPFYPHMTVKEVNQVIKTVRKLTKRYKK